jgi:hypothetical protein
LDATYTRGLLQNRRYPRKDFPKAGIIPLDHQAVVSCEGDDLMEKLRIRKYLIKIKNAGHWKIAGSPTKEIAPNAAQLYSQTDITTSRQMSCGMRGCGVANNHWTRNGLRQISKLDSTDHGRQHTNININNIYFDDSENITYSGVF